MTLRLVVRMSTRRPSDVTTRYPHLDQIAPVSHYGFYLLVFLVLHVLAVLFQPFFLKGGLLRRMWFGQRAPNSLALMK